MKIVMTGATGYMGTKLVQRLSKTGYEVYAVARVGSNTEKIKTYINGIVFMDPVLDMYEKIREIAPDVYINLAGVYYGRHAPEKIGEMYEGNVILPSYLTDAVVRAGCSHVIHTASYQQCYNGEYYHPINLYAATKQAFEDILYFYVSTKRVNAVTLQLFDTYGADDGRNKIFNLIRRMKEGERIELSPGEQKLYFCYIDDVIEAYVKAIGLLQEMETGIYKRYAVRDEKPISLKEFVGYYIEVTKKKVLLEWGKRSYAEKEIMDPTGFGEVVPGWSPLVSYREGIRKCGEYDMEKNTDNTLGC